MSNISHQWSSSTATVGRLLQLLATPATSVKTHWSRREARFLLPARPFRVSNQIVFIFLLPISVAAGAVLPFQFLTLHSSAVSYTHQQIPLGGGYSCWIAHHAIGNLKPVNE